jgi:hypothetical protein
MFENKPVHQLRFFSDEVVFVTDSLKPTRHQIRVIIIHYVIAFCSHENNEIVTIADDGSKSIKSNFRTLLMLLVSLLRWSPSDCNEKSGKTCAKLIAPVVLSEFCDVNALTTQLN